MEVIVKGMKKLCVCMLVCGCFFAVSAKNAEAGPFSNFLCNIQNILGLSDIEVLTVEEAENASRNYKDDRGRGARGTVVIRKDVYPIIEKVYAAASRADRRSLTGVEGNVSDFLIGIVASSISMKQTIQNKKIYIIDFDPMNAGLPPGWESVHGRVAEDDSVSFY
jgi:hypothetical protein